MDVQQLRRLLNRLRRFLQWFDNGFPRKDTRAHLPTYVTDQLSDLPEKSVEPIAGGPDNTLSGRHSRVACGRRNMFFFYKFTYENKRIFVFTLGTLSQ